MPTGARLNLLPLLQGGLRALPLRRVAASAATLERPAPTGPAAEHVPVSFEVPACSLAFGEHLRVVGSCPELGGWDAQQAPALEWGEGDTWAAALALPPGQHAFKLVVMRQDGSTVWEEGDNRSLAVAAAAGAPALRAVCRFGDTGATEASVDVPEPEAAAQVGQGGAAGRGPCRKRLHPPVLRQRMRCSGMWPGAAAMHTAGRQHPTEPCCCCLPCAAGRGPGCRAPQHC